MWPTPCSLPAPFCLACSHRRSTLPRVLPSHPPAWCRDLLPLCCPAHPTLPAGGVKKARAKKDKDAPKRGRSAYMFYSQAVRDDVKKENPEATFGEVGS